MQCQSVPRSALSRPLTARELSGGLSSSKPIELSRAPAGVAQPWRQGVAVLSQADRILARGRIERTAGKLEAAPTYCFVPCK